MVCENGAVDFSYNGEYTAVDGIVYVIHNGLVIE